MSEDDILQYLLSKNWVPTDDGWLYPGSTIPPLDDRRAYNMAKLISDADDDEARRLDEMRGA